jgi:chromosome segregation ATPase
MNKFYVIVPLVLCGLFAFVYIDHSKDMDVKKAQIAEAKAKAEAEEAAKKAEAERKAKEDSDRRTAERLAEEKKKEDEKRAKWAAAGKEIQDDLDGYNAKIAQFTKQIAALETELKNVRADRAQTNKDAFELRRDVELAKVDRRNAELDIQRFTEMIARRANESALAKPPAPPAPAAK